MAQQGEGLLSPRSDTPLKYWLSWLAWPGLFTLCMVLTGIAFSFDLPIMGFIFSYIVLIVSLFFLERFMPHEHDWLEPDGQTFADIAHTLTTKGTVQTLFLFAGVIGLSELFTPATAQGYGVLGAELWPRSWPLGLQVAFAVVVSEFFLYWSHRTAHEIPILWRFHAVHHSVTRLWFVNTGRFHFMDSLYRVLMGMIPLTLLGAPMEVLQWLAAVTAFIGMLTHCNVEMRFGWLSYVFNTPGLHRWHHSRDIKEGNKNYGENVVLWDILFRTFINPQDRRPPVNVGISEFMPAKFTHQLLWPFLNKEKRKDFKTKAPGMGRAAKSSDA
ncbi:MAG: sterol desaturase family protein [Alphaproteobacteria bacterium]|nr:sterol desaturase family protein [Alphaproteobacteria bacterium]MCB9975687.1 sterol desaturase family protein [Rhodospirillales bacterium]